MTALSAAELSAAELARLHEVADVLVPAGDGAPSLREADPDGEWIGRALATRPDVDRFRALLASLDGDVEARLRALFADSRSDFEVIAGVVGGAYFLTPAARAFVGYPGQTRSPVGVDEAVDDLEDLIESAMSYVRTARDA